MKPSLNRTRKHLIKHKKNYVFSFLFLLTLFVGLPLNNAIAAVGNNRGQGMDRALEVYQELYRRAHTKKTQQQSEPQEDSSYEGANSNPETILYDEGGNRNDVTQNAETGSKPEASGKEDKAYAENPNAMLPNPFDPELSAYLSDLKTAAMQEPEKKSVCYDNGKPFECSNAFKYMVALQEANTEFNSQIEKFREENGYTIYFDDKNNKIDPLPDDIKEYLNNNVYAPYNAANAKAQSIYNNALLNGLEEEGVLKQAKRKAIMNAPEAEKSTMDRFLGELAGEVEVTWNGIIPAKKMLEYFKGEDSYASICCEESMLNYPEPGTLDYWKKTAWGVAAPVAAGAAIYAAGSAIASGGAMAGLGSAWSWIAGHKAVTATVAGITAIGTRTSGYNEEKVVTQQQLIQNNRAYNQERLQQLQQRLNQLQEQSANNEQNINQMISQVSTSRTEAQAEAYYKLQNFTESRASVPSVYENGPSAQELGAQINNDWQQHISNVKETYSTPPATSSSEASSNVVDELKSMSSDEWEAAFEKAGMD